MKTSIFNSKKDFSNLSLYQRMIECFASAALIKGKYLDLMNFSKKEFKQVIDPISIEKIFKPEHGYTSPDGSLELSLLIKEFEVQRLIKNSNFTREKAEKILSKTAVGLGNGVTGVLAGIFYAINNIKDFNKKEVITFRPSYPLAESLAEQSGFTIIPVYTKRENFFLPSFEDIAENVSKETAAIILVYPNNPTFTTFRDKLTLKKIVDFCQREKIFLIVDNIYQEMMFGNKKHLEIFSLTEKPEYIIKLYGPSKDRPFFTGHRLGYYIGDPRIEEFYFDYCSVNFVCLGTFPKNIFSLDLLFRILLYKEEAVLKIEDIDLLMPFLKGWMQKIDNENLYKKIKMGKIFEKYKKAIEFNNKKLIQNLTDIKEFISQSPVFSDVINDNGGNAIFIKINPNYFSGNDLELYEELLIRRRIAIYPGNIFGMEIKEKEAWFRITVIHDSKKTIINLLEEIEIVCLK